MTSKGITLHEYLTEHASDSFAMTRITLYRYNYLQLAFKRMPSPNYSLMASVLCHLGSGYPSVYCVQNVPISRA